MSRSRLFGERPAAVVSLVDAPVSRSFAQRARVAFWVTTVAGGVLAAVALSTVLPVVAAVLLGALIGVAAGFVVALVVRAWPVLRVLLSWSFEIAVVALVATGSNALARVTSPLLMALLLTGLMVAAALVGPVRRFVVAWFWCGVVRHRLRLCFGQFIRSASRSQTGSLPLILLARPTPAGERVWVWLRPGLDLTDLEGRTGKLAVACWAGEVRVVRASARFAALLRVDITRRDPLTATVASPLAELVGKPSEDNAPVSPGMPPLGLDLDDVPEPPAESPRSRR